MRIKSIIAIIIIVLSISTFVNAQNTDEIFTIYLVRHAEKEQTLNMSGNPPLTKCGEKRAKSLASFLHDVDLDAIYSTNYTRTKKTAEPTALDKDIDVKMYNPKELKKFAQLLIKSKEDVLVIGHSNTTGVLAGLLAGKDIGSFDESIYNRIYQVVVYKDKARLHILHTSVECKK